MNAARLENRGLLGALCRHYPEYLMEAALLGLFMVTACAFGVLLEHPASALRGAIPDPFLRRALMGLAMGATAVALICSPWGRQSGAHMNPAVTLAFLRLGKIEPRDAIFYMAAQFAGGALGVALMLRFFGAELADPAVNYVATQPGRWGSPAAWPAEFAIAFAMMMTVLLVSNYRPLSPFTALFSGCLVMFYIAFEAPISGMSLNPARSFASALPSGAWGGFWIYLTAPPAAMLAAAVVYIRLAGASRVYCAKLDHAGGKRCIFNCRYGEMPAAEPIAQSAAQGR